MKRYIAVIRLNAGDNTVMRLKKAVPALMETISRIARGESQLAFSSASGETFAVFLKTSINAAQIRAEIEKCPELLNGDHIMALEIGEDWNAIGNSRGWQWLQHH